MGRWHTAIILGLVTVLIVLSAPLSAQALSYAKVDRTATGATSDSLTVTLNYWADNADAGQTFSLKLRHGLTTDYELGETERTLTMPAPSCDLWAVGEANCPPTIRESITVSGLSPCTRYAYRIELSRSDNPEQPAGGWGILETTGCTPVETNETELVEREKQPRPLARPRLTLDQLTKGKPATISRRLGKVSAWSRLSGKAISSKGESTRLRTLEVLAVRQGAKKGCQALSEGRWRSQSCARARESWQSVKLRGGAERASWSYRLRALKPGRYTIRLRLTEVGPQGESSKTVRIKLKVRSRSSVSWTIS